MGRRKGGGDVTYVTRARPDCAQRGRLQVSQNEVMKVEQGEKIQSGRGSPEPDTCVQQRLDKVVGAHVRGKGKIPSRDIFCNSRFRFLFFVGVRREGEEKGRREEEPSHA